MISTQAMRSGGWWRAAGWLVLVAVAAAAWGCAGLIPAELQYMVDIDPILPKGRGDYHIDPEDSSVVFSKEGAIVAIRHLTDEELNREFPPLLDGRHVNPYTYAEVDPNKGYAPPRFTVFDVTVTNNTYAKVEFDPAKAVLITDQGEEFRYYDAGREGANPLGGNSFSKYFFHSLIGCKIFSFFNADGCKESFFYII